MKLYPPVRPPVKKLSTGFKQLRDRMYAEFNTVRRKKPMDWIFVRFSVSEKNVHTNAHERKWNARTHTSDGI